MMPVSAHECDGSEQAVKPRGAIFDCDGVLLDTMGLWYELEDALALRAGHILTVEEKDALRTYTLPEAARFYYEKLHLGKSSDDVIAMTETLAVEYYRTKACPRAGIQNVLECFCSAGIRCAVASSSPHSMLDPGLTCAGLAQFFDVVVSVDDIGVSKREPAVYDYARTCIGTSQETTWVFEDAAYALRTLRRAGYHCVGVWDSDDSGTFDELAELADAALHSWAEFDIARFLAGGYTR